MSRLLIVLIGVVALLAPGTAAAWWNSDWAFRRQITLQATESREAEFNLIVPVRLHVGNFMFADASASGADLRFIAADDKTPLKFHIARYDATNGLAFAWVMFPKSGAGAGDKMWVCYGNKRAPAASDPGGSYDPATTAVFHFSVDEPQPRDVDPQGNIDRFELRGSTGNPGLDAELRSAVGAVRKLRQPPPRALPQPVRLRITSTPQD